MRNYSEDFLKKLNKAKLKTHYAKITLLNFDEIPITEIQGKITSGTINVNSSSAIRRTLSLSMLVDDSIANITNIENQISINKKVKVAIGLKNPFSEYIEEYGEIVWFSQGVFVLSSANSSRSTSGWSLSITAKDKMSLLDGSAGGTFPAPTVLSDKYIYLADGSVKIEYPVLRQIIYEAVNHYGNEDPSNIFINDLDDTIKMLVKYDGFQPIYYIQRDNKNGIYTFNEPSGGKYKTIQTGEDVGYKLTDFTYPGELVLNPGETVVTLLDKIVNILGNYEYFYDIDGHFIFQEIKNYVNKQSPLDRLDTDNNDYLPNFAASDYVRLYDTSRAVYQLSDLDTAAAITQTPRYDNVKNDFYVWGERSNNHPIHYHLAIDAKPKLYYCLQEIEEITNEKGEVVNYFFNIKDTDKIKPMLVKKDTVLDYGDYPSSGGTPKKLKLTKDVIFAASTGQTYYNFSSGSSCYKNLRLKKSVDSSCYIYPYYSHKYPACTLNQPYDWREEFYRHALYLQTTTGFGYGDNYYYEELIGFWRKLYDPSNSEWDSTNHWNPDVYDNPENLDFWLDIIDTGSELGRYSIGQIGRRTKTINKKEIKTIYNKEVPDLVFVPAKEEDRTEAEQEAFNSADQDICQLPDSRWDLFSISSTGASCFDEIRDLLYQHLNYHTTITITCLPVYYLEPNNILYIEDSKSGIIGNYQITQFSLPLTYNGTMNITATEVFQRI